IAIGTIIPPRPTTSGSASRRRSRSSPMSNSRRASRPTTRKKNVISPEFTQPRKLSARPVVPTRIDSAVCHVAAYPDESMFAQASAASAAASSTAALPVSVRRNWRSGVSRLRAHTVRSENSEAGESDSVTAGFSPTPRQHAMPEPTRRIFCCGCPCHRYLPRLITTASRPAGYRFRRQHPQQSHRSSPPLRRQHRPDPGTRSHRLPGTPPHLAHPPPLTSAGEPQPPPATVLPRSASPRTRASRQRQFSLHGHQRWPIEENFQAAKGLTGLDEHQVRRWASWYRWTTLAMLALAFLSIAAATEHTCHPPPPGQIPLTRNEVATLFGTLVIEPARDTSHRLRWSAWRRRHQHRARTCHYQRQARQP